MMLVPEACDLMGRNIKLEFKGGFGMIGSSSDIKRVLFKPAL